MYIAYLGPLSRHNNRVAVTVVHTLGVYLHYCWDTAKSVISLFLRGSYLLQDNICNNRACHTAAITGITILDLYLLKRQRLISIGIPIINQRWSSNINQQCKHKPWQYIEGLVKDCSNSSALAIGSLQSCIKSSIWRNSNMTNSCNVISKSVIEKTGNINNSHIGVIYFYMVSYNFRKRSLSKQGRHAEGTITQF